VELENAFGRPGTEWRTHLDAAKLKACGFHHTLAELQGEKLAATVEFNQAIGNPYLIIRSLAPEVYKSADLLKKTADAVNEAAEKVKPHKMRVGYHNHSADFNRIDGEYWWNRFADATTKDVVLQLDTGNASQLTGAIIIDLVRRNAGRTRTMHVKPFSKQNPDAHIGADELDWPAIMTAVESTGGVEWYNHRVRTRGRAAGRRAQSEPRGLQEDASVGGLAFRAQTEQVEPRAFGPGALKLRGDRCTGRARGGRPCAGERLGEPALPGAAFVCRSPNSKLASSGLPGRPVAAL